jgi:hypothetical protein
MSKPVQLDAILSGISTKQDGSLSLRFSTLELSPEHTLPLLDLRNQNLLMTLSPLGSNEPPQEIVAEKDAKTPSQRMRSILFAAYKYDIETGKETQSTPFEYYYQRRIDRICEKIKSTLPPK